MSFWARLKFIFGMVVVFLAVGLLALYANAELSVVRAGHAELGADGTTVGVDYPGHIINQYITDGEAVKKGEPLFVINSPALAADVANRTVQATSLPYKFDAHTGDITIHATQDGVVDKVNYLAGSFVPTGAVLTTINTVDSLYVAGHFHLNPPDYARIHDGSSMQITFPDNTKATGTVYSVALQSNGGGVDTIVKARLQSGSGNALRFPVGTPVQASLKLAQQTWWEQLKREVTKLLKPAGQ